MTVSTTTNKVSYSGTGSQTVFAYTFKIFADGDLDVYIRDTNGTETLQTITTNYTVSGAGADAGGNVTFVTAPGSTDTVVIQRKLDLTQGTDYVANDPFPAESHEDALDRLTFITQQIQEEVDRSIKASVTNTISTTEFAVSATDRANKFFAFDSAGDLIVSQEIGTFRGNWAASTSYAQRDIVKDTSTNNIFIVNTAHTSSGAQPLTTNANSAKYDLLVDAASATTSATAAAASATTASGHADDAQDWAVKVNGIVESTDYSSKAWAIGGTGVTDTSSRGAAKEWATETSGTVDTSEYSAKEYAQGTQSGTGGSAKSWAQTAEDSVVSGGEYSAKHYSAKASASATAAAASAVSTAADVVSTNADVVSTNADVVSAQASATAASNSAAALAAALDGFDDKYLGIMADTDTASSASTTATWVLGGSTLTVASATGIEVGQNVSATGIPNQANVLSIDGTSVVISHVATAAGSGAAVTFQGYGVYGAFDSSIDGPSTDNDNGALSEGMLYFNSTDNEMRVYDGANWIAASAATQASMNIFEYTATASQTTFSGADDNGATLSYTADNLIVMMNGAVLDPDEFTATNGTSVVLDSGAALNDELVIFAFKSFQVADTVSKSSGGTFNSAITIDGDLTVDTNTLHVDSTNNRVGIGTTSPQKQFVVSDAGGMGIELSPDDGGNGYSRILNYDRTGNAFEPLRIEAEDLRFHTNGTERMRILSSGGITFNGDTAAANALDDYEEGTWTPALSGPTTVAYSSQIGTYTKIGRMVWLSFSVTFSTAPTGSSNYRFIIPFTPEGSSSRMYGGDIFMDTALVTSNYGHFLGVYNGSTSVYVYTSTGSARSGSSAWQTGTLSGHIFINT